MIRPKVYILCFASALAMLCVACKPRYDYKAQVILLDSLNTVWGKEFDEALAHIDDSVALWRDTVAIQLQLIQAQYTGKMKKSRALSLSQYHAVIDDCAEVEQGIIRLQEMRKMETHRLQILSKALAERADKDAQGNAIDPPYVAKALQAEESAHQLLMQALKTVWRRKENASENFHALYPLVQHMTDSLSLRHAAL